MSSLLSFSLPPLLFCLPALPFFPALTGWCAAGCSIPFLELTIGSPRTSNGAFQAKRDAAFGELMAGLMLGSVLRSSTCYSFDKAVHSGGAIGSLPTVWFLPDRRGIL